MIAYIAIGIAAIMIVGLVYAIHRCSNRWGDKQETKTDKKGAPKRTYKKKPKGATVFQIVASNGQRVKEGAWRELKVARTAEPAPLQEDDVGGNSA